MNATASPKVSLIVPTLSRSGDLKNLLASIGRQSSLPLEVIVVDQSDDLLTKHVVSEFGRKNLGCRVVYIHRSVKSSAQARNAGIDAASGDLISFTDDDVVLEPDYFEKILPYFSDPSVGGVTGYAVNEPHPAGFKVGIRRSLMRIFLLSNFGGRMTASGFGYPLFKQPLKTVRQVELFSGYSMTVRRELLMKERFDDWFSGYSFREDVDLSYRLSRHAKLLAVPDARFHHMEAAANRMDFERFKKMQAKNYIYVFKKSKDRGFLRRALFAYSVVGLVLLDLSEFLTTGSREKWQAFKASLSAWSGAR